MNVCILHWSLEEYYAAREAVWKSHIDLVANQARASALEDAMRTCWKVVDEKIGIYDQVEAYKLGHSGGAYECGEQIRALLPKADAGR